MSNWKDKYPSKYLRAEDIGDSAGDSRPTVARRTVSESIGRAGDEDRWVTYFTDLKPLPLNVTNCKSLEKLAGTGDPAEWRDITIELYLVETTMPNGDPTLGIRIRAPRGGGSKKTKPAPRPEPDDPLPSVTTTPPAAAAGADVGDIDFALGTNPGTPSPATTPAATIPDATVNAVVAAILADRTHPLWEQFNQMQQAAKAATEAF